MLTEDADTSFDDNGGIFPEVLFRPWAGGTDSLHTMIYFNKYGRDFFKFTSINQIVEVDEITDDEIRRLSVAVNGNVIESRFDLGDIVKHRGSFFIYIDNRTSIPAEPTSAAFTEWTKSVPVAFPQEESNYWIVVEDKCGKLNKLVYKLLLAVARKPVAVGEILARIPEELRQRVLNYLIELENNGFISFKDGDRIIKKSAMIDPDAVRRQQYWARPRWKMPSTPEASVMPIASEN